MTLVLLHPVGLDGRCWQFLEPDAAPGAIRYDLLWHGGRPRPTGPLTLAAMADDVAGRVDGPLDLVGLSLGGAVAQEVAIRHGGRVRSLLLACTSAETPNVDTGMARARRAEAVGADGMLAETLQRWFTPAALADPDHPGVRYVRQQLVTNSAAAFAAGWLVLATRQASDRLRGVTVPATVVHAVGDASVSHAAAERLAGLIPGADLVCMAGPHMVQLERPREFSAVLRQHLNRVAAPTGKAVPASGQDGPAHGGEEAP